MFRTMWFGLVAASMLAAITFNRSAIADDAPPAANTEDLNAIRASADAFSKAYAARDADAIAALFDANADYIDEEGTTVRGRDAIKADYVAVFADGIERAIQINVKSVRLITPDVAVEDGEFEITPEPPGPPCDRKYSAVHVKREGKWMISTIRDTRLNKPSHYEHLKELEWMIGDWIDESPDSLVETSCQWSDNKNYIIRKYKMKIAGVNLGEGVQRIGWDPANNRIRSWLFDADGGYVDGAWSKDGDRWMIESSGVLSDGTKTAATGVLTKIDNEKFTFAAQDRSQGDQRVSDVAEMTIVRKPPAAKTQEASSK